MTSPGGGDRSERELVEQLRAMRSGARRRRWPLVAIGVVVGVLTSFLIGAAVGGGDDGDDVTTTDGLLAVAEVTTTDLVSFRSYDGVLGFGEPTEVTSPVDAFVTWSSAVDDELGRGDVLLHLNGEPVVVWFGETPLFRDVGPGVGPGDDVRLVEQNLAVAGFDADGTLVVDGFYDAATEQAVIAWQESLGVETDGVLDREAVVVVAGPVRVADAPVIGSSSYAGTVLVELTVLERRTTVGVTPPDPPDDGDDDGTGEGTDGEVEVPAAVEATPVGAVESLPAVGAEIADGDVVYSLGGSPVVALVDPDDVGEALVAADDAAVERALAREGFADLAAWATARGLDVDMSDASFVEVPPGAGVASVLVSEATELAAGDPVLEVRASTRRVEVDLSVDDLDALALGDPVVVELSDGTAVDAVVVARGTVADLVVDGTAVNGPTEPVATVDVRIELADDGPGTITEGPVTVRAVDEEILDAVVVPVRALLSLAEGGFAVEVVGQSGMTSLVGVELGTFDDGVVEVTNSAVSPGDSVVVPQ